MKPGLHGHAYCSAIQISAWWKRLQSSTGYQKIMNDGEGEKIEVRNCSKCSERRFPLRGLLPSIN